MANSLKCEEFWDSVLSRIKDNDSIKSTSFESWFLPIKPLTIKDSTLYLGLTASFIIEWIDKSYKSMLIKYINDLSDGQIIDYKLIHIYEDGSYDVQMLENNNRTTFEETDKSADKYNVTKNKGSNNFTDKKIPSLIPSYTFDNFVVGENNRFAHAAALVCAETPGKIYNPLFLYGGVGLGKTHLMHAIGHYIKENNPDFKVGYFTTENFVNEWITAIKTNTPEEFRQKYRRYDVILMDDIQFLSNKGSCQEEFFHTYNALHESGSQIVLSSDRPPEEIPKIEDRLVSRFVWGLTTEIQPPDLETRIAILQKKAEQNHIILSNSNKEVLFYIANQYDSNIRFLEGAFNKVIATSNITGEPISLSLTKKALDNFASENKSKNISIELIIQSTADYFNVKASDITGKRRIANLTYPRQIAMYLAREMTDATYQQIGNEFGKKHYSTVIHACDEIADKLNKDKNTQKNIKALSDKISKM